MAFNPITPTEQLMYATARVEGYKGTSLTSYGTAFFFSVQVDSNSHGIVLITNKHVVEGVDSCVILLHLCDASGTKPSGSFIRLRLVGPWFDHPSADIDLCAFPVGGILGGGLLPPVFFKTIPAEIIPNNKELYDLDAVEDVIMIGYPNGLWDEANNYPIIRQGTTATHPATNFNGEPNFVIDIACFPGSSGSPIIQIDRGGKPDKRGNVSIGRNIVRFLGVLHSGPVFAANGSIVPLPIPTSSDLVVSTRIMMNLGYAVKASEVVALWSALEKYPSSVNRNFIIPA